MYTYRGSDGLSHRQVENSAMRRARIKEKREDSITLSRGSWTGGRFRMEKGLCLCRTLIAEDSCGGNRTTHRRLALLPLTQSAA